MNRYNYKILKHLTTPNKDNSQETVINIHCPSITQMCIDDLIKNEYILQVYEKYSINENFKPYPANGYIILPKGLDALQMYKDEQNRFWIPVILNGVASLMAIGISVIALICN